MTDPDPLWELSEDLLVVADYDGHILRANPVWRALFGLSREELLRGPYTDITHPDDVSRSLGMVFQMRDSGVPVRFENRIRGHDGGWLWISWRLSPDPNGAQFLGIGRDITEQKLKAEEFERMETVLRQSQKMEAVGQLTGGLAHDFNNLLMIISGSFERLQSAIDAGHPAECARFMATGQQATARAAAITQRLLTFARRQTLRPRPISVNQLVHDLLELIRHSMGPRIRVQFLPQAALWQCTVDPQQLDNALLNLCLNARDAMPDGGSLRIETGNLTLDASAARLMEVQPGDYVAIAVIDQGVGMSSEVAARVFEPFYTTKPPGMGTGLGLSMVYGFVRQSGGTVKLTTASGSGTRMELLLPRISHSVGLSSGASSPGSSASAFNTEPLTGRSVLLVEDDPVIRVLLAEVLEELGLAVVEAAEGAGARVHLQAQMPFDLLICDVGLPDVSGRELARSVRADHPQVPVLFIIGYDDPLSLSGLAPPLETLVKPFSLGAFSGTVRRLLVDRPEGAVSAV